MLSDFTKITGIVAMYFDEITLGVMVRFCSEVNYQFIFVSLFYVPITPPPMPQIMCYHS